MTRDALPSRTAGRWARPLGRVAALALGLFGLAAALVVLYRVDPAGSPYYPKCALHELTGWHCPGCGATRAAYALLHGRLAEALRYNPLIFVVLAAVVIVLPWTAGRRFVARHVGWVAAVCAVLILAFGVARNIPRFPFRFLAPPDTTQRDRS